MILPSLRFHSTVASTWPLALYFSRSFGRSNRITVKRGGVTNGEKFFGGVVSQHADECRIYGEKIPFAGDPEHSVGCVLDQTSIASFAGAKRIDGTRFRVAQFFFLARSNQSSGKARQLIFQDVIGDSLFDTFHRQAITEGAGNKNQGDVEASLLDFGQRVHSCPARQAIVGDDDVERLLN